MAKMDRLRMARRTFLKTSTAVIGLPFLEAMLPFKTPSFAQALRAPQRFVACYVPNGVNTSKWYLPSRETGALPAVLPETLQPLEAFRNNLLMLSNVGHVAAVRGRWDGSGNAHAFAASSFLTGVTLDSGRKEYYAGTSIDQLIAAKLAMNSPLASMELGCDPSNLAPPCVSFSPVFPQTISWRTPTSPLPKEISPQKAFQRLFSVTQEEADEKKSILDATVELTADLVRKHGLSHSDKTKIEEFQTSIRETEKWLANLQKPLDNLDEEQKLFAVDPRLDEYGKHLSLMFRIMTLAFKSDMTRVISFMMGQEISDRTYPELGIYEAHHTLSHNMVAQGSQYANVALAKINRFHVQEFSNFIRQLSAEREPTGETLLDNSLILYGGGMSDGNTHSLKDLPLLVMGGRAAPFAWGKHLMTPEGTSVAHLHLTLARAMGLNINTFTEAHQIINGMHR